MRKSFWMLALCLMAALAMTGCKSQTPPEDLQPVPEAAEDPNGMGGAGFNSMNGGGFGPGEADGRWNKGANDASVGGGAGGADADGWTLADPTGNRLGMPIVYFAYDSDVLVPSETANLDKIAQYLIENPSLGLVIEGHCDNRGTDEYNRSLSERRANAIRAYLAGKGVPDANMKTVPYGKDKPAVPGTGESIWRQNRRGVPVPMQIPQK